MTRAPSREPIVNIEKTLSLNVGGFIGVGKTKSVNKITLAKDLYFPGEDIVVNIDCDNSKCSKSVKNFKVKLRRNLLALGYNGSVAKHKKYIAQIKVPEKCEAHATKQIELRLPIPESDYVEAAHTPEFLRQSYLSQITKDLRPVMKAFTPSMIGQIVHIWYDLHVVVKHDAWNEVGVGNIMPFHVQIDARPPMENLRSSERFEHDNWTPEQFNN